MSESRPAREPRGEPIYEYVAGDAPLLISFPHSGTYLPPTLALRLRTEVLDLPDTDWFVPKLYDFHREFGISILRATHSRYVVDLNRPPDDAPLYPGQRGTGVCPIETFDAEPLYAPGAAPIRGEIEQRLHNYWRPYHARLQGLIAQTVARHGHCVLWDAHSILSTVPQLFEGRLPDLNLGTADGRSCSPSRASRLAEKLSAQTRFTSVVNGRFKGGYITRHYGNPAAGVDAVQLEIAQAAYLTEMRTPQFDLERAAPLRALLRGLVGTALEP
ncbi:MAG: N-formylglutamate deformylase [Steroidobacteraceae bacterium]